MQTIQRFYSVTFLFIFLQAALASAGNEGHGGPGRICRDNNGKIASVELLDFYDGLSMIPKLEMGPITGNYMDNVYYVLNRLSHVDPVAAYRFKQRADVFQANMEPLTTDQMKKIDDSNPVNEMGTNCTKETLVYQRTNPRPFQKRYSYNSDYWPYVPILHKAGAVLHEIVYQDAFTIFKQETSDNTRFYNFMISSDKMNTITELDYVNIVVSAKFFLQDHTCLFSFNLENGYPACLNPYYPEDIPSEDAVRKMRLKSGSEIPISLVKLDESHPKERLPKYIYVSEDTKVTMNGYDVVILKGWNEIHPNLSFKVVFLDKDLSINQKGAHLTLPKNHYLEFYEDGAIKSVNLGENGTITVGGRIFPTGDKDPKDTSIFFETGEPKTIVLSTNTNLILVHNNLDLSGGDIIGFREDGTISGIIIHNVDEKFRLGDQDFVLFGNTAILISKKEGILAGTLKSFTPSDPKDSPFLPLTIPPDQSPRFKIRNNAVTISFFENGKICYVWVKRGIFKDTQGKEIKLEENRDSKDKKKFYPYLIHLNEKGELLEYESSKELLSEP